MSIRARLLLLITFATLIPALVGGLFFLGYRQSQIEDAKHSLANETQQVAQAISDTIRSTAQLHYGLSRARDFDTKDPAECSNFLSEVLTEHPQYTGILTIKPDGQLFCDSLRTGRKLNLTDRKYFQQILKAKNPLAIEAVFGRLTGTAVLQIAYGVRDKRGNLKFVLLASLDLEKYMHTQFQGLAQINPKIALMKSDGTLLSWHPERKEMAGKAIAGTPLFNFALEERGVNVRENVVFEGESRIWAASTLPDFGDVGLHVLVGVSQSDLLAAANAKLNDALLTLATVWLLVFAAAWALTELVIRRQAARIIATVDRFCKGDFGARIGAPYPRGELGELMAELDNAFAMMMSQRDQIQTLNEDLERRVSERTAQLEVSIKEMESFTYTVSHDLRAPLRAINGFASLLIRDSAAQLDAEALKRLDAVCRNSKRMGELIDDLLAFSRMARATLQSTRIDMHALVSDVIDEYRQHDETLPQFVIGTLRPAHGDTALIKQVWVNLIGNAIKFSSKHPQPVVEIASLESAGEHVYSVKDNGAGFDMRYYDKLFGVFQRLHDTSEFPGTGVGLAIVQRVISRHGGRVWADSKVDAGATFYFSLPRAN